MKLKLIVKCIIVFFYFTSCTNKETHKLTLPVFGEKHISNSDTIYHTVGGFTFTNQFNDNVSESTIKNKIYVADFFFATCQSICPQMSTNLKLVQEAFKTDSDILILCHTVNPMHDTVEVLNSYAQNYGAIKNKWHFLTGNKKDIYKTARYDYLVNAFEDDGSAEGFLHSELLILVDKKQRIRGYYDGTNETEVKKLIEDIKVLKKELEEV
jgi:protein SCO1/2